MGVSYTVFNEILNGKRPVTTEYALLLEAALGTDAKHLNPVVTTLGVKGERAKGLVDYEKVAIEGEEKPVKYVFLTEDGKNFVPSDDEE